MTAALATLAERWGVSPALVSLTFAAVSTLFVLLAQSVVGWFENRNLQ